MQKKEQIAIWQSQKDFPTSTPRTLQLVAVLEDAIGREVIEKAMEDYFAKNPKGEQVTLACLEAIGEDRLRKLSLEEARSKGKTSTVEKTKLWNSMKQRAGVWIAIVLAEKYGSANVLTYRRGENGPSSTRIVPDIFRYGHKLDWVSSYTPHQVLDRTSRRRS